MVQLMSTCLHGTKSFFCCLKSLALTYLVVCLINLGDGGGEYVEGQSLCPCYKSDSHFLSFLEAELHFLISNVQYVTAAFISVHVLRNLYSNLMGPFKKMDTQKIFLPVLTEKSRTHQDSESTSSLFPAQSYNHRTILPLHVGIDIFPAYIGRETYMDFHVSSLRILYNQERKWPGKGCCHNLPSPSDLKQLETPPTRGGRAQRRTRTLMLLFYTAFQHCFTGAKKNPSATATASSRMWRGYRCFHYLCIPQNTGKFLHHLP